MAFNFNDITATVVIPVAADGGTPTVILSGSTPAGDDVTGSGSDAAVDLGVSVQHVDFYNDGTVAATISNGTETRSVPAGVGRLVYFSVAAQSFAVVADGDWIATPMA